MLGLSRHTPSWQLILADLALILFLMTAAALGAERGPQTAASVPNADPSAKRPAPVSIAPAQALYRAGPDMPSLEQWLESQPRDPRASLTIIAQHIPGGEETAWSDARLMASTARAMNIRARVIIREGQENAVQASLAYDQPAF
jgi:hypothetical protein